MQAADLRDRDDPPDATGHDWTWVGAILVERKMGARSVVVVYVPEQNAAQMALIEDDDVIQTLAANRTDHTLDVSVLPGRARRRDDFFDPNRIDPLAEYRAVRRVTIAQQVARSTVPREGFCYLAGEPRCGGMLGDGRVKDPPAIGARMIIT
jgi:hypothetical protein